jgi:flagellar basal-body rod modification protein FlgD
VYTPLLQSLNLPSHASAANAAASPAANASPTDPGVDLTNTFLQLLTVQLKNQSPLDPLDPNAFVAQLAQFDSLGELTQIQELMQTLVNDVTPT